MKRMGLAPFDYVGGANSPLLYDTPRLVSNENDVRHEVYAVYLALQTRDMLESAQGGGAVSAIIDFLTATGSGVRAVIPKKWRPAGTAELRTRMLLPLRALPGVFRLDVKAKFDLDEDWKKMQGRACQLSCEFGDGQGTVFYTAEVLCAAAPAAPPKDKGTPKAKF